MAYFWKSRDTLSWRADASFYLYLLACACVQLSEKILINKSQLVRSEWIKPQKRQHCRPMHRQEALSAIFSFFLEFSLCHLVLPHRWSKTHFQIVIDLYSVRKLIQYTQYFFSLWFPCRYYRLLKTNSFTSPTERTPNPSLQTSSTRKMQSTWATVWKANGKIFCWSTNQEETISD